MTPATGLFSVRRIGLSVFLCIVSLFCQSSLSCIPPGLDAAEWHHGVVYSGARCERFILISEGKAFRVSNRKNMKKGKWGFKLVSGRLIMQAWHAGATAVLRWLICKDQLLPAKFKPFCQLNIWNTFFTRAKCRKSTRLPWLAPEIGTSHCAVTSTA